MSAFQRSSAVLTYWDGRGNAEIIRLMLAITDEEWVEGVFGADESETHVSNAEQMKVMIDAGVLGFDQVNFGDSMIRLNGIIMLA